MPTETILNILLGFALSNLILVQLRNKESSRTPYHFSLLFYLRDTWAKMLVSLLISFSIAYLIILNNVAELNWVIWVTIGGSSDAAIEVFRKLTGITMPKEIEHKGRRYVRK
jgi:hypothetical protein